MPVMVASHHPVINSLPTVCVVQLLSIGFTHEVLSLGADSPDEV